MFKYKKLLLNSIFLIFIICYFIEFIKYLFFDSNIFGVYYLIINLFILFFMVPVVYNYKRYYSKARISKVIIIILLGLFCSFFLDNIIINNISYMDGSNDYLEGIFIVKNIIKPIVYVLLVLFIFLETKAYLKLKRKHQPKLKKKVR